MKEGRSGADDLRDALAALTNDSGTLSPEPTSTPEAYFFGCWREPGHYYWTPRMERVQPSLKPWAASIDSKDFAYSTDWLMKKLDDWTAIGRRDNTVDKRPGCHSTFVFHADLTLIEALAMAALTFPEVWARINPVGDSNG